MTKEDAVDLFRKLVHKVHADGLFISGCIQVDAAAPCARCNYQMVLYEDKGIIKRKCPKCDDAGREHIVVSPSYVVAPVVPIPQMRPTNSDAPMCSKCGDLMIRRGTCYYCENCGESSGCS